MSWLIGGSLVIGAVLTAVAWMIWQRRVDREAMLNLTRMNRGRMDEPGWARKPWEHDDHVPSRSAISTQPIPKKPRED